ncbi:hypothetical protein NE237_018541 [Protea cynaroides]|uniref:Uncharacterized protein n=3 Tax=Spermatophyta TaxID=58024 RepID=A0A9Q0KA38_9MAGN|nr:hypothetical protein NE237_018541 [Protea cynaroides]
MSLRIKAVVDKFVKELKEALDADIQDRIMKEREMQSYIEEREKEVAEREAAWKAELSRREAEIARQEARLKIERENLEKEKSVLMGTASNQDNQDGALEITVSGGTHYATDEVIFMYLTAMICPNLYIALPFLSIGTGCCDCHPFHSNADIFKDWHPPGVCSSNSLFC